MNLAVIGSGGREHAICYKLKQSPKIKKLICIPGNAGTQKIAENIKGDISNFQALYQIIIKKNIDIVVVGPEQPLVEGLVDYLNDKKVILESSCYSILAKFLNLIAIYFIFLSFGIDLGVISSGIIYYTSLLIGVLSFIPAGLIITETSMLAILLQHKVEFSIAILIMITLRIVQTWVIAIAGTITYSLIKTLSL